MKRNQILLFAGVCGILVGACNLLSSVAYVLLPAAQKLGSPGAALLPSLAQSPTLLILLHLGFTAIGIFGLGLVPGLTALVRTPNNEGWLGWASTLATVGYAVFAVSGPLTIDHITRVAQAYVTGDASTQAALLPLWRGTLDPFAFWGYGVVGFWILLSSLAGVMAPGGGSLRLLSVLGILVGLLQMLIPLGFVFKVPLLFAVVNILGAVGVTLWYVWAGLALWGASSRAPAAAAR